jgi:hypothetical protein
MHHFDLEYEIKKCTEEFNRHINNLRFTKDILDIIGPILDTAMVVAMPFKLMFNIPQTLKSDIFNRHDVIKQIQKRIELTEIHETFDSVYKAYTITCKHKTLNIEFNFYI